MSERASELIGMEDSWTAIQFDLAVDTMGRWIEHKANEIEYDSNNKPRNKYNLEGLLKSRREQPRRSFDEKIIEMGKLRGFAGTGLKRRGTSI